MQELGYSSYDKTKVTLNAMSPGMIPETFLMSSSEISYFISEAVRPHFNTLKILKMCRKAAHRHDWDIIF